LSFKDHGDGDYCPVEGHGRMYVLKNGRQWCPHSDHNSTGREHKMAFTPKDGTSALDKEPTPIRAAAKAPKPEKAKTTTPRVAKADKAPRAAKTPQECTCGCKGMTKGGRFLPGHDARYHAAQKREAEAAKA